MNDVVEKLHQVGFAVYDAARPHPDIGALVAAEDWARFAASWNGMPRDEYMADGGKYRRRRFQVYSLTGDTMTLVSGQPHYQTSADNHLNGGIERWFEDIPSAVATGTTMTEILKICQETFSHMSPAVDGWHVEVHQFRIEAVDGAAGNPTPEGMHRDGVDYVLVLMVARHNIASGTTTMADANKQPVGSFTLTKPGDCVLLDDHRVYHGVTPIIPANPSEPAHRDVLVVTFSNAATRGRR